jgi:uncharacterized protein (TIGR02147 family)
MKPPKPSIFRYHDYRAFLRDWFSWAKADKRAELSMRSVAKLSGLAVGLLPMVLAGRRSLSQQTLRRLQPHLGLQSAERKHLELLWEIGESEDPTHRLESLRRLQKSAEYKRENPIDVDAHEYLSRWTNIAIHELAQIDGFSNDPSWIQGRLGFAATLSEVKASLEFLHRAGFLVEEAGKPSRPKQRELDCTEGVFKISLGAFHRQALDLAARSIDDFSREERDLQGHTFSLRRRDFDKIKHILSEALNEIQKMAASESDAEEVYHVEMAAFPVTRSSTKQEIP